MTTPVEQGVGVQLLDTGLEGPPDYGRPDVYIGTQNDGLLPDPITNGSSRTYTMQVSNTGNILETITVFPAAAYLSPDGGWYPTSDGVNDATAWISLSPQEVTLEPAGAGNVQVAVSVPTGTTPGTYYAVVWAGPQVPSGEGINIAVQAGIRAYITVQ